MVDQTYVVDSGRECRYGRVCELRGTLRPGAGRKVARRRLVGPLRRARWYLGIPVLRAESASLRVLRELRQFPPAAREVVHPIALALNDDLDGAIHQGATRCRRGFW